MTTQTMTHGLVVAATVSPECTRQQMRANRGRRKPTERLWDGLRVRRLHDSFAAANFTRRNYPTSSAEFDPSPLLPLILKRILPLSVARLTYQVSAAPAER